MPTITRRVATVLAAAIAVAAAGCGSGASPTPAMVSANFKDGLATVSMTGAYTATYPAQLMRGTLVEGGAAMAVEFGNVQTGALTYQGPATPGTYATERTDTSVTTLALTVVLTSGDKPSDSFASTAGECSITIVEMASTKGNATFTCTDLANVDGTATIDASGKFSVVP